MQREGDSSILSCCRSSSLTGLNLLPGSIRFLCGLHSLWLPYSLPSLVGQWIMLSARWIEKGASWSWSYTVSLCHHLIVSYKGQPDRQWDGPCIGRAENPGRQEQIISIFWVRLSQIRKTFFNRNFWKDLIKTLSVDEVSPFGAFEGWLTLIFQN